MTKTLQLANRFLIGQGDSLSGTLYAPGPKNRAAISRKLLFRLMLLLVVMGLAQAGWSQVVIGGWNTSGLPGGLNDFGPSPFAATSAASNVTVGGLTRGAGVGTSGTAAARAWGGTNWNATEAGGISGNQFFTFTVKANAGYKLSLSSIDPFDYRRSGTGPGSGTIQYQINGGGYSTIATVSFPSTATGGASVGSTDLTGIPALQNLPSSSTVTFRIIPYGASGAAGTFYIFDTGNSTANDFAVNGTVCPVIAFTATPTNTCPAADNGQIAVSGVTGGVAPYTYSKDNGANYQSGATFTGLAANTYQVVVKDVNGCTSGATPVDVGTFTPPGCSISGPLLVCPNSADITYSAPAGMDSYSWSISGAGSIPGSTTGQSVSVTSGNFLGDYTVSVTITDDNGCPSTCSKQSLIYLPKPSADITVNPNPACFGVSLDLSIFTQASYTVSWSGEGITDPDGDFILFGFPIYYNKTTAIPTTTGPHTYSVTVVADYGCANTGTATVTVNPLPAAPSCPSNSSVCLGTPAYDLSGGSPGGGVYSGPGVSGGNFNPAAAGVGTHTIVYKVTDGNGCTNTCSFTITVNSPPACYITFTNPPPWGQDTACANSTGNIYSAPAGMDAYSWSLVGSGSITSATTGSSVTVTAGTSDYYLYVTITDDNGCVSNCSDYTPVKASPTCSVNGPASVCSNSTGNVHTVTTNEPSSYTWGISGDGMITSGTNGSSVTVTAGASGVYTVSVTTVWSFNSCGSSCSQTVTVEACCEFVASCPSNADLGTYNCNTLVNIPAMPATLAQLQAAPYNITLGDNPCGQIKFTVSDNATPIICSAANQTITRTIVVWDDLSPFNNVKDVNEASTTCTYTYVVQADKTNPQFTACPVAPIDLGCNPTLPNEDKAKTDAGPATDNCGTPVKTAVGGSITGACVKTQIWTVTATDGCNDTSTCTVTYTWKSDTENPQFTACPTAAIYLGCNPPLPDAEKAKTDAGPATDNCGTPVKSAVGGAITGDCTKTQIWTVTATDGCNNTSTCTVTYTWKSDTENLIGIVTNNAGKGTVTYTRKSETQNPQFTSCPGAPIDLGCNPTLPNAEKAKTDAGPATDNCGGTPAKSAVPGSVTGTCVKTQTWTVTATDECGRTATCMVTYTWKSDTEKPEIADIADYSLTGCNPNWPTLSTTWTDNCSGSGNVNGTAGTVYTSGCLQWRTYTFTKTDGCGNTDVETTKVTRTYDVTKPVFVSGVPANITVQCSNVPAPGNPVATDNCDPSVDISFMESRTNGACPDSYVLTRKWTAKDDCGNTKTATHKITVVDNTKPYFTWVPANLTVECSGCCGPDIPVDNPTAADNCDASVTITYLGEVCTYFNCPANRQLKRTWKATDNCGNWTTAVQLIDIQDTKAPVFTYVPQDLTIECDDPFPQNPGAPTATDGCSGYVQITYNGQSSAPGDCPQEYTVMRKWTAADECGNTVTATQTITVWDTQAPTFNNAPADVTVMCGMVPDVPIVTATDNCDTYVPVTYLGEVNTGPNCPYTITRTWTVTDDCGNPRTHTQSITVGSLPVDGPDEPELRADLSRDSKGSHLPFAVALAPNPALEEVWVSFESETDGEATLRLFDVSGRLAVQQSFTASVGVNRYRLDLAGLGGGGMYTVHLLAGDRQAVERLVVLKN